MDAVISFLAAAVVAGTPLLFATLGEILTEKAGNLNLGVEGLMLMGAVMGFSIGYKTGNPGMAILAAMIAGALGVLIYTVLTVNLRANQTVSGLAISIFGTGFSNFVGRNIVGKNVPAHVSQFFQPLNIPGLSHIPFIGPIFFKQDILVYLGYIAAIIMGIYFYRTYRGLNLKAVGENPAAADSASINVNLYKYVHILIGGALCGLGGAYLSLAYVPSWQDNVTAGRGWIAVALVVFAAWNPYKAIFASYLFGGLDIISFRMKNMFVSQYFIDMLPYIVTIAILVFVYMKKSNKNAPPKSLGTPYFREER